MMNKSIYIVLIVVFGCSLTPEIEESTDKIEESTDTGDMSGRIEGVVYEIWGDATTIISEAQITLQSEDGNFYKMAISNANGNYSVTLPIGRYHAIATHPEYELFTTCQGFVGVTSQENIFNIKMRLKGSGCKKKNNNFDPSQQMDQPPSIEISVNKTTLRLGESLEVTLNGSDDTGLHSIWWWGTGSCENDIYQAHWYACQDSKNCQNTWVVTPSSLGNLILEANSRDNMYPTTGEAHQASEGLGIACVEVKIIDIID